jgi:hypothetical protein
LQDEPTRVAASLLYYAEGATSGLHRLELPFAWAVHRWDNARELGTTRENQKKLDPKVLEAAARTRRNVRNAARSAGRRSDAGGVPHHIDLSALSMEQLVTLLEDATKRLKTEE